MESLIPERRAVACYREYEPRPALRARVRALFSFTRLTDPPAGRRMLCEFRFGRGDIFTPTFADGDASVVFDLGVSLHADGRWLSNAGATGHVLGAMTNVGAVRRGDLPAMVGAYFRPAQLVQFTRLPAPELTDRVVAVDDLWKGTRARELGAELAVLDEGERLNRLEQAMLDHGDDRREAAGGTAALAPALAAWVRTHRGRTSVDVLAQQAGVSRQHLTRVFRERVGVSPKLYCRLVRFQSALPYVRRREVEWARVATELGYADQSHMIAEFREFSSLTPEMLAREMRFHPFIEGVQFRG